MDKLSDDEKNEEPPNSLKDKKEIKEEEDSDPHTSKEQTRNHIKTG